MLNINDKLIRETLQEVGSDAFTILNIIASHIGKNGHRTAFPGIERIRKMAIVDTGGELKPMTKKRAYRAINRLIDTKQLHRDQPRNGKNFGRTIYTVTSEYIGVYFGVNQFQMIENQDVHGVGDLSDARLSDARLSVTKIATDKAINKKQAIKNSKSINKEKKINKKPSFINSEEKKLIRRVGRAQFDLLRQVEIDLPAELHAAFIDWLEYKKKKRKYTTVRGMSSVIKKIKSNESIAVEAINEAIDSEWSGIYYESVRRKKSSSLSKVEKRKAERQDVNTKQFMAIHGIHPKDATPEMLAEFMQ